MPDTKITALTAIGANPIIPATFPIPMVDLTDTSMAASGTTKKVTVNQILGAGGTATLASATITGDLTVDTSTLKVDSANDRVSVGHTSPLAKVDIRQSAAAEALKVYLNDNGSTNIVNFRSFDNVGGEVTRFAIAANGVATWSYVGGVAGTAMTLNSTGLGVGASPVVPLHIFSGGTGTTDFGNVVGTFRTGASGRAVALQFSDTSNFANIGMLSGALQFAAGGSTTHMTISTAGNVGIGVTPSAWVSTFKALNVSSYAAFGGNSDDKLTLVGNNYYNDATAKFIGNGYAGAYSIYQGAHRFQISTTNNSSGAGAALTFTQAMTLDASGNLLVGKTGNNGTVGNGIINQADGAIWSTMAASTSASNTLLVYSTGAAAYRFYVNLAGTVFATNTTISAISDARFKENVQDIDVGLGAILALKPRKFDWKEGKGKNIKGDRGFIAQEFETVFPNLIDEWKDEAPEGEAPYKSVRQDLIPVLVKAIQELTARVQTLETR